MTPRDFNAEARAVADQRDAKRGRELAETWINGNRSDAVRAINQDNLEGKYGRAERIAEATVDALPFKEFGSFYRALWADLVDLLKTEEDVR